MSGPQPTLSPDRYDEAASALRKNTLWECVQRHVVVGHETSCRTAIDLIVLTAVGLAQQQITESQDVDEGLCARHQLPEAKCRDTEDKFLTRPNLYDPPQLIHHIHNSLCSILEAKAPNTMDSENAWPQVTAQGAALCLLTKRPSVVNTVTDGLHWQFVHITKMPDPGSTSPPRKAARSERTLTSTTSASPSHQDGSRKSLSRLAKKPALPPVAKTKPFKAATTRILNIFHGRDFAIVLRLLTLAILSSPEEFEKLTEKKTRLSSA